MCISITEADAIRISMHSQRYDTLKINEAVSDAMRCHAMPCDTIHPYYDAVRLYSIQRITASHSTIQNKLLMAEYCHVRHLERLL